MIPTPEEDDDSLVIVFKLLIALLTILTILFTTLGKTRLMLKRKRTRMGFGKE